jgi:hypothetical protein
VTFFARIKNTGSQAASSVHAELLGIDQDWYNSGQPVGGGPWLNREKLPEEEHCRYTTNGFSLLPPNPQFGTEGASRACSWKYIAPPLPPTTTLTYTPTVRVYYAYRTDVVRLITIVPRDQLRLLQDSGRELPGEITSQSRSPVQMTVETPGPIRASSASVEFPLRITVDNRDGGIACYPATTDSCKRTNTNWNKVAVTVRLPAALELADCDMTTVLDLVQGRSNSFTCTVRASGINLDIPNQATATVTADYMYLTDKSTSIRVSGSQQLP